MSPLSSSKISEWYAESSQKKSKSWVQFDDRPLLRLVPTEIWWKIFGNLGAKELGMLDLTCRSFNCLLDHYPSYSRPGPLWRLAKEGVFHAVSQDEVEDHKDSFQSVDGEKYILCHSGSVFRFIQESRKLEKCQLPVEGEEISVCTLAPESILVLHEGDKLLYCVRSPTCKTSFDEKWSLTFGSYTDYDSIHKATISRNLLCVEFSKDYGWVDWDGFGSDDGYDDERNTVVVIDMKAGKQLFSEESPGLNWDIHTRTLVYSGGWGCKNNNQLTFRSLATNRVLHREVPGAIIRICLDQHSRNLRVQYRRPNITYAWSELRLD